MTEIETLRAELREAGDRIAAAEARATNAEAALAEVQMASRREAVTALFREIGRDYTDEAAAPYMGLTLEVFAAVAADLRAARPAAPGHLFREQAVESGEPAAPRVRIIDTMRRTSAA
jgi:hypothetical protein